MTKNWYPIIDYSKCTGCLTCVSFCPHGVYAVENGKPKVVNPDGCVDFCVACQKLCPAGAIAYYDGFSYNERLLKRRQAMERAVARYLEERFKAEESRAGPAQYS